MSSSPKEQKSTKEDPVSPKALSTQEEEEVEKPETLEGSTKPADDGPADDKTEGEDSAKLEIAQQEWQAIWSPQHNAYYFFNARTQETTWTNPLVSSTEAAPSAEASSSKQEPAATSTAESSQSLAVDSAALNGIDPELAFLDPTLYAARPNGAPPNTFSAKFNARTGRFTAGDARDPSYLSEAERAKRMSSVFFDVEKWEQEVAARKEEEAQTGDKRKKPTKADLERWKDAKKRKKMAKHAWLKN